MSIVAKGYEDVSMKFSYQYSYEDPHPEPGVIRLQRTFHHDNPDIPCVEVTFGNKS